MDKNAPPSVPRAVQACHELMVWLIPHLDDFPRIRRYTLGERLETGFLAVLEALLEAAYSREKRAALTRANRQLEINRHLWRLAYELKATSFKSYESGAHLIDDLGRQIGGWLKTRGAAGETP